jgi:phosphoribosylaminoimidazolecarboxamide formyltransferase/IMP cyclohydrolase
MIGMNTSAITVKRALLSVSDKQGIVELAVSLHQMGIEIISTGNTARELARNGITTIPVDQFTGSPEMMGGRIKTMHPMIMGGILALRDRDAQEASQHNIHWIDLVVCNLYPFAQTIARQECSFDEALEQIDVGGPTMIRAAAKNVGWVCTVTDKKDYRTIIEQLNTNGTIDYHTRRQFAAKAFAHTASYDALIQDYLSEKLSFPEEISYTFTLHKDSRPGVSHTDALLRYGENPHQKAAVYQALRAPGTVDPFSLLDCRVLQGKRLSFNNLSDAQKTIDIVREFSNCACVVVKHAIPCGVATADTVEQAVMQAVEADKLSAFGGIAAMNRMCNAETARYLSSMFLEVVAAPAYEQAALDIFKTKKNLRIIETGTLPAPVKSIVGRFIGNDLLLQERDNAVVGPDQLQVVTQRSPTENEVAQLIFSWQVVRHVRSNAIVIANEQVTLGIGSGQVSRVDAVRLALSKAKDKGQCVLASDAFFPFRDSIDMLKDSQVTAVIQPGGSIRDEQVIEACNELNIAMVFTGIRCFSHA